MATNVVVAPRIRVRARRCPLRGAAPIARSVSRSLAADSVLRQGHDGQRSSDLPGTGGVGSGTGDGGTEGRPRPGSDRQRAAEERVVGVSRFQRWLYRFGWREEPEPIEHPALKEVIQMRQTIQQWERTGHFWAEHLRGIGSAEARGNDQ